MKCCFAFERMPRIQCNGTIWKLPLNILGTLLSDLGGEKKKKRARKHCLKCHKHTVINDATILPSTWQVHYFLWGGTDMFRALFIFSGTIKRRKTGTIRKGKEKDFSVNNWGSKDLNITALMKFSMQSTEWAGKRGKKVNMVKWSKVFVWCRNWLWFSKKTSASIICNCR